MVKYRIIQLVVSGLLVALLLFNQAGVNYMHDTHDAHAAISGDRSKGVILPHGDHCKICSIDVLFNLYFSVPSEYQVPRHEVSVYLSRPTAQPIRVVTLARNKAPPAADSMATAGA